MPIRALTWNLFHGRDAPPEPGLMTWRSRLLRTTERGRSHAQVNRDLREQFAAAIAAADWDVALLQECPPRWGEELAKRCDADAHLVPTSRNLPLVGPLQGLLADLTPDLIASWEGGSNLTLVRSARGAAAIAERRVEELTRAPERRVMALTRLASGLCVANLHASGNRELAERDVIAAAGAAIGWSGDAPLLFGGDLNIRPRHSASTFERLRDELGLTAPTGPDAIDHLLVRGLEIVEPAEQWPDAEREAPDPTAPPGATPLPIRLSDHAPVSATFSMPQADAQ